MADFTGTNGNDFFFFQGNLQQLTLTITNPFSSISYNIDEEKFVNNSSYEGLSGIDLLFMTDLGDAVFLRDPTTDEQVVFNIEIFFAGNGGDVIHLADTEYSLGNITVIGGAASDLILSNIGDDTLNGNEGGDTIDGGPGSDILFGGSGNGINSGNDWLHGGLGADLLRGEDGDDTLVFSVDGLFEEGYYAYNVGSPGTAGTAKLVHAVDTNLSLDIYDGGTGFDILLLTDGDDTFFLDDPYHEFHLQGSSLRLIGVEQIDAGDGRDIVDLTHDTLSYGNIIINGGGGDDFLWSSDGDDVLNGGTGNDNLFGGFGDDELNGEDGADILYGSLGNDIVRGGAGDDRIFGGVGSSSEFISITERTHVFNSTVLFPDLRERVDILDLVPSGENALGIAAGDLSVDFSTTASVTFLSSGAGFNNSLGFYNVALDGTIMSVELAFPNVKSVAPGQSATIELPGAPDTDFGFFIIANGARKNNDFRDYDLENGEFRFIYNHGQADERLANINDHEDNIQLVFFDGVVEKVVVGSNNHIYHTTTRGGSTNLNGDGQVHVVSGVLEGSDGRTMRIGFEDLPNLGDADFNDVVFDLTVQSKTEILLLAEDGDQLFGGAGSDVIDGGIGDDLIVGGEGADTLYGDQGRDIFLYQSLSDAGDSIMDFASGAGGDVVNVAALLEGYDALQDDINDFINLTQNGADIVLGVNADGTGSDFTALLTFTGGLGGAGVSDLLAFGNLAADQIIPV